MCTNPYYGIRVLDYDTGAVTVKFIGSVKQGYHFMPTDIGGESIGDLVQFPCGQCMQCRVKKAKDWSIRLLHESYLHKRSCFLTLTYSDSNLPESGTLVKKHVQDFMKDLRRYLDHHYNIKVRFFAVGEYGSKSYRPHYHLILFGYDFAESRKFWKRGKSGDKYFRSDLLERLWSYGFSVIGSVTDDSVFYVARYVTKKIKGDLAEFVYDGVIPEFALMSRRPGIGHDFVLYYKDDIYKFDEVITKKFKARPPSYYDRIFADLEPENLVMIKEKRASVSSAFAENLMNTRFKDGFTAKAHNDYLSNMDLVAKSKLMLKEKIETL